MSAAVASGVLKRDRLVVLSGLAAVTALAWTYMFYLDWNMSNMDMAMPLMQTWDVAYLVLTFIMWAVMMVAMMTPSATPMILTFAQLNRQRQMQQRPLIPTGMFLLGYLLIWVCFSAQRKIGQIRKRPRRSCANRDRTTSISSCRSLTSRACCLWGLCASLVSR